jgi:hypothetical protein
MRKVGSRPVQSDWMRPDASPLPLEIAGVPHVAFGGRVSNASEAMIRLATPLGAQPSVFPIGHRRRQAAPPSRGDLPRAETHQERKVSGREQ